MKYLILISLVWSGTALALHDEIFDNKPFWRRVQIAAELGDLDRLKFLVRKAPIGQPLAGIDGSLLARLNDLYRDLGERAAEKMRNEIIEPVLNLGADPHDLMPATQQPVYTHLLGAWSALGPGLSEDAAWKARRRATEFFELLLDSKKLTLSARPTVGEAEGAFACTLLQWSVLTRGPISMYEYFLRNGAPRGGVDGWGRNIIMLLAEQGEMRELKAFVANVGPTEVASAFDFEQKGPDGWSTLDAALNAIRWDRNPRHVRKVISYLCAHGANPDRIESGKNIADRAEDFALDSKDFHKEFKSLARGLRKALPALRTSYRHYERSLTCINQLTAKRKTLER